MSDIKPFDPQFDERGTIIPKQKFCASCKKRLECDKLYQKQKENHTTNEYAEITVALYYTCDDIEPIYIEFPILVNGISSDLAYNRGENEFRVGDWTIVSVNAEGYDEDFHIGLYLGMLPLSILSMYDRKSTKIVNKFNPNPAIYIPKFKKIFYGMNCRWQFLDSLEQIEGLFKDEPQEYLDVVKKSLQKDKKPVDKLIHLPV